MASVKSLKLMMVDSDLIQLCKCKVYAFNQQRISILKVLNLHIANHIMTDYKGPFKIQPVYLNLCFL